MKPKWKKFEQLAYEIQKELAGDAQVVLDARLAGIDSKRQRQIDISIRRKIAQFDMLLVVECKDYKKPVNVSTVEAFVTKIKDVRANKGAIISSSGFSGAAIESARVHQIDTFRLVDTENVDWQVYASAPALLARTWLYSFSLRFSEFDSLPTAMFATDLRMMNIYQGNQSLGTVGNIIAEKWNSEEIKHLPDRVQIQIGKNVNFEIDGIRTSASIAADVVVARKYYFGSVALSTRGLKNEQNGGLITRAFTIDKISPFEIEQGLVDGWAEIENPDELAIIPLIKLDYSDWIPVSS